MVISQDHQRKPDRCYCKPTKRFALQIATGLARSFEASVASSIGHDSQIMAPPTKPSEYNPVTSKWSREQVIRAVQTPLGFFSLVVLVVEAMLGILAGFSTGSQRTFLVWGILLLIALLVLVVTFLAYKRPDVLKEGSANPSQVNMIPHLDRIEKALARLDQIGRYGSSGALIASLFGLENKLSVRAHCHAGGLTITPILLENLPKTVNDFYDMVRGDSNELKLAEHHLIDNFLRNLITTIPSGATWFGITRLQSREAWARDTATIAYCEFQEMAECRTRNQELNFFRLWGFDDKDHFDRAKDVMRRQEDAGFEVRFIVGRPLEDISLIWAPVNPTEKLVKIKNPKSPFDEIKAKPNIFQPLCAFKFEPPRGGRELEEMTICTGEEQFKGLVRYFRDQWTLAEALPVA